MISIERAVSITGGIGCDLTSTVSLEAGFLEVDGSWETVEVGEDAPAGAVVAEVGIKAVVSAVEAPGWSFFSFSLASSPSTRLRRASRTSVLGPLFFGTASVQNITAMDQSPVSSAGAAA